MKTRQKITCFRDTSLEALYLHGHTAFNFTTKTSKILENTSKLTLIIANFNKNNHLIMSMNKFPLEFFKSFAFFLELPAYSLLFVEGNLYPKNLIHTWLKSFYFFENLQMLCIQDNEVFIKWTLSPQWQTLISWNITLYAPRKEFPQCIVQRTASKETLLV